MDRHTGRNVSTLTTSVLLACVLAGCGSGGSGGDTNAGSIPLTSSSSGSTSNSTSTTAITTYSGGTGGGAQYTVELSNSDGTTSGSTSGGTTSGGGSASLGNTLDANGTFTITNTSTNPATTYTGTYTPLVSGFTQLTCTDSTGCAGFGFMAAPDVAIIWFTQPAPGTLPIILATNGTCPTSDTTDNFVRIPNTNQQTFGWEGGAIGSGQSLLTYAPAAQVPYNFTGTNVTFAPMSFTVRNDPGYICEANGTLSKTTITNGVPNTVQVTLANSGVMIQNDGSQGGGAMGLTVPPSAVTPLLATTVNSQSIPYLGVQWSGTATSPVVIPLKGKYVAKGSSASLNYSSANGNNGGSTQCNNTTLTGCLYQKAFDPVANSVSGPWASMTPQEELSSNGINYYGLFSTVDDINHNQAQLYPGEGYINVNTLSNGQWIFLKTGKATDGSNAAYNGIMRQDFTQ